MAMLHQHLLSHRYRLIDAQVMNPHLASLGAKALKRADFINLLKRFRDIEVASDAWHPQEVQIEL